MYATVNGTLVVCPFEDTARGVSKLFRMFMLKLATRGVSLGYLTHAVFSPHVAQREGGVVTEALIAAGRSCSSV